MDLQTLQKIIELTLVLLGIIISTYVVPYIKSKYDSSELDKLREYVEYGVRCAEMYFGTQDGLKKKEFVLNYIKGVIGKIVHTDITDEQLDVLIEGVVNAVKYPKGE